MHKLPYKIKPELRYEIKTKVLKETPKLGIIIPTKGNVGLLKQCINSIIDNGGYLTNTMIYIADTGSSDEEKIEIKNSIGGVDGFNIRFIEYDFYNFAVINNDMVENHVQKDTEVLLFCNNDIKVVNNAINLMMDVYIKNKKTVGTIGCRLHYEDNTVQHSGVVMFLHQNRQVGITHYGLRSYYTYHNYLKRDIF